MRSTAIPRSISWFPCFGSAASTRGCCPSQEERPLPAPPAPGLSQINVFETPNTGNVKFANDILTSMATTLPLSNQLSSSWFFGVDSNTQPILYELAIQGQSFFQAAGDQGSNSWGTDPG